MNEEKKLILQMLSEGKITIQEAEDLLDAQSTAIKDDTSTIKPTSKRFLKIFIKEGENTKININFPLALAEAGLKLIPTDQLKIEGYDIDVNEIISLIKEGNTGEFVNVDTVNDGKDIKIKICIEWFSVFLWEKLIIWEASLTNIQTLSNLSAKHPKFR